MVPASSRCWPPPPEVSLSLSTANDDDVLSPILLGIDQAIDDLGLFFARQPPACVACRGDRSRAIPHAPYACRACSYDKAAPASQWLRRALRNEPSVPSFSARVQKAISVSLLTSRNCMRPISAAWLAQS